MIDQQEAERLRLQAKLAYSAARSDIEMHCARVGNGSARWNILKFTPEALLGQAEQEVRAIVTDAVNYLDWSGCIESSPHTPHIVRIRDASWP